MRVDSTGESTRCSAVLRGITEQIDSRDGLWQQQLRMTHTATCDDRSLTRPRVFVPPSFQRPPIAMASSFSAILESSGEAVTESPEELVAIVGGSLYAKLNHLFTLYPGIDELGLLLGMPTSMKKAAEGAAEPDAIARYDEQHPPPASLQALQAKHCPPIVVMESTKLGIAFWCIPLLVRFAMLRFQELRSRMKAEALDSKQLVDMARTALAQAGKGASLDSLVTTAGPSKCLPLPLDLLYCTRILLLINADNYTAWNARKLLLSAPAIREATSVEEASLRLLTPEQELRFLNLVYSKHPKSGESWSHRRWVLSRMPGYESQYHFDATASDVSASAAAASAPTPAASAATAAAASESLYSSALWQGEVSMCERSAELYPKNYYAWMHRAWLIERISSRSDLSIELEDRMSEWTDAHINDYSGFFHRQVIWNHFLHTFAKEIDAGMETQNKGDAVARVHANLPILLRHWSKPFPSSNDFVREATAAIAAAPSEASSAASVAVTVSSPSSSSSAASLQSSLHSSLAHCSFCSLFSSLEWSHINELQCRYPGHESLWMHRRFVWHAYVAAVQQHAQQAEKEVAASTGSSSSSSEVESESSFPSIPSWLLPLVQRELDYSDLQLSDRELSDYAANAVFASLYKAWVLHSALTLVYQGRMQQRQQAADSTSAFPLIQVLSPQHRTWYLSVLQPITRIQPDLMQRAHWKQRADACSS